MTALVIAEAVAIALLALLVAGLLRSHGEILKALHELGAGRGEGHDHGQDFVPAASTASIVSELDFPGVRDGIASPRSVADAERVQDISGVTPWDESVAVGVSGDARRTLIAFLSTGCGVCANFWDELNGPGGAQLPSTTRLVVVTKGEHDESISALRRIAPSDSLVVMSSEAWSDYEVPGSPYFLLVEEGRVAGEGSGSTWSQVRALLGQASDDTEVRRRRSGRGAKSASVSLNGIGPNDIGDAGGRDRADRVDAELSAAGILPGHPSLYASEGASTAAQPDAE
jgi:hypothetical protein